jgi:hypothetical protein
MAGVFQIIDPPPAGGGHTCWVERGWGVNILEDVRHSSVLYVCKYFVRYLNSSQARQAVHFHRHFAAVAAATAQLPVVAVAPRPHIVVVCDAERLSVARPTGHVHHLEYV